MKEQRTIGLGYTLVDAKIITSENSLKSLPVEPIGIVSFIDRHPEAILVAGGSTPNVMAAYVGFAPERPVMLLAAVGEDKKGAFYRQALDSRLGELQQSKTEPTGVVAILLDEGGQLLDSKSFYGAATTVQVPEYAVDDEDIGLFVTNSVVFRHSQVISAVKKVTDILKRTNGIFALNLTGTAPNKLAREALLSGLTSLDIMPDIVVGNENEALYITAENNVRDALSSFFPESRLAIITQDERGSLLRFENTIITIPAFTCPDVVDPTGAGDCYMGILLGCLSEMQHDKWTDTDIRRAANTASYGASLVVGKLTSRLDPQDFYKVTAFHADSL